MHGTRPRRWCEGLNLAHSRTRKPRSKCERHLSFSHVCPIVLQLNPQVVEILLIMSVSSSKVLKKHGFPVLTRMKAIPSDMALYLIMIESSSKTIFPAKAAATSRSASDISGGSFCVSDRKVSIEDDSLYSWTRRAEKRFVATKLSTSGVLA